MGISSIPIETCRFCKRNKAFTYITIKEKNLLICRPICEPCKKLKIYLDKPNTEG